jgi:RimJ/RimL family protein N-acetyltransferase
MFNNGRVSSTNPAADDRISDVLLKDGSTVRLRPIAPHDTELLRDLFHRTSPRSRYLRFHHQPGELSDQELIRFTDVDYANSFGLVASLGEATDERIIGIGHYFRSGQSSAEVAFLVEDSYQGRGIATQILDALTSIARANGIESFEADVLGENQSMMEVFRAAGYPLRSVLRFGTFHVEFLIQDTEEAQANAAEREVRLPVLVCLSLRPMSWRGARQ